MILENFYQKSRNSVDTGRRSGRRLRYSRGAARRDARRRVVNMLRMQGIEVGSAKSEVKLKGRHVPAGSYIVKRD